MLNATGASLSAGDASRVAPWASRPAPFSGVRCQPWTPPPAASRRSAIASPIRPTPSQLTWRSVWFIDVACLLQAGRAAVAPDQHGPVGVGGLPEPVRLARPGDDHVTRLHPHVAVPDAGDPGPFHQILDLLGVRVPVNVVAAAGRERGDAEHGLLRAAASPRDHPLDGHVHPAVLLAVLIGGRDGSDPDFFWVRVPHPPVPTVPSSFGNGDGGLDCPWGPPARARVPAPLPGPGARARAGDGSEVVVVDVGLGGDERIGHVDSV